MTTTPLILVVDDDPFMREISRQQLEAAGYAVELADGGEAGVAKARSLRPAAILMDFAMPGMSGSQALEQVRRATECARTPVVMLTAWSSEKDQATAEQLGATWLQKPLGGDALVVAIRAALQQTPAP